MHESLDDALRVAVVAPVGRDAALTRTLLERAGLQVVAYPSLSAVCTEGLDGLGALLLTEEALEMPDMNVLESALGSQPGWSDIAVLVFAGGELARGQGVLKRRVAHLTNVTIVERPVTAAVLVSLVQTVLRARARQFDMRDVLVSLHAARDQAERASRLKDEFLATLSHELRTPLNAILGWTAMLRQDAVEADRVPRVLDIIERNARAQAQLVSDVLDVSRMITGKIRLNARIMPLAESVKDAIDTIRPGADARGVRIEFEDSRDPLLVHADPERIQQVVWNLLMNAVKFTPPDGRVTVRAARTAAFVELSVTDTGVGLSPDFLPFVFDRFRQADQSFTRAHGGLGLGLSIVKQVIEMHGGQVSAASEGPGRGAVFTVRLPPALSGNSDTSGERPTHEPEIDLARRAVLVVDDDGSTRELLSTMLTRAGALVTAAGSADEAIACIDAHVPDLLIADIGMPGEDGLSLCRRIRARPAESGGAVPALALSAYTRAEDRAAASAAGFDGFVAKPTTPSEVLEAVAALVRDGR
jgi:signal transduction histidine kinase/ActR/RegA family two-component response regulator